MVDPELPCLLVGACKGQPVLYPVVGKEGGVKINSHIPFFGKGHPLCKMLRPDFISVHKLPFLKDGIAGMEIQLLFARHQPKRLIHVLHQFFGGSCFPGIIPRGLYAAGQGSVMVKANHIIPLPAVKGNRDLLQPGDGLIRVHSYFCIPFLCGLISFSLIHHFTLLLSVFGNLLSYDPFSVL